MKKPHSSSQILLKFVMWSESKCAVMNVRSFPGSYNCCNCLSMETPWAHYRLLMSTHGPTESLAESVLQYPSHRKGCEIFRQSCQLYLTNRHHIQTLMPKEYMFNWIVDIICWLSPNIVRSQVICRCSDDQFGVHLYWQRYQVIV